MIPQRSSHAGTLMVVLSAVCFSAKAIFAKLAYRHGVDPLTLLALRAAFALPFFALAGIHAARRPGAQPFTLREHGALFLLGSVGYYAASLLDFIGLTYVSAGLERLILFLYPTMVIALNVVFHSERPSRRLLDAVLLSYGGVGLVVWNDRVSGSTRVALGSALVFLSAVTYAGYIAFSQRLILRHGSTRVTGYILVVTCLCALAQFSLQRDIHALAQPREVIVLAAATGILATVIPAFLLTAGMKRLGTSKASLLGTIGPVSTLFFAAIWLDEPITLLQIAGSALVLFGIWRISQTAAPRPTPAALSEQP